MGVDCSDVRYHPKVALPDGQGDQHALIVPAINQEGAQNAELIMLLSKDGSHITQTVLRGDAEKSVAVIQRGDDTSTVFIANNLVDAKSIAVGDSSVTIFMSLHHYHDLNDIAWVIDTLPKKPGAIALVTDHFSVQNDKTLFALGAPLRDHQHSVVMVKGKLKGDYTHVSINEALRAQDKIRSTTYLHRNAITPPAQEKSSLVDRLARVVKRKKTAPAEALPVRRPPARQRSSYYIAFTKPERRALKDYFASKEQLVAHDDYRHAVRVANAANTVYDTLRDKVRAINFHPQRISRIASACDARVTRDRILQRQPIGLLDAASLLKEVATVKLDTESRQALTLLASHLSAQDYSQTFKARAIEFMRTKATLIQAWRNNDCMPGSGHSFLARDVAIRPGDRIDRDVFLGIARVLSETAYDAKQSRHQKQAWGNQHDHSRGGRSR